MAGFSGILFKLQDGSKRLFGCISYVPDYNSKSTQNFMPELHYVIVKWGLGSTTFVTSLYITNIVRGRGLQ